MQLELPLLIEVVKVVDNEIRICKIQGAVISRMAVKYSSKNLIFIEKNTKEHKDFIQQYKIRQFPTLMFFLNSKLKKQVSRILPTPEILDIIENIQYL
jgi:thiol-disulfide isomerase/thioredoxin